MVSDMWTLMALKADEVRAKYPVARRFIDLGFQLDPRNHADNLLALTSLNQSIRLNLTSGDCEFTTPSEGFCHA